jgi:hypothetical protein
VKVKNPQAHTVTREHYTGEARSSSITRLAAQACTRRALATVTGNARYRLCANQLIAPPPE